MPDFLTVIKVHPLQELLLQLDEWFWIRTTSLSTATEFPMSSLGAHLVGGWPTGQWTHWNS